MSHPAAQVGFSQFESKTARNIRNPRSSASISPVSSLRHGHNYPRAQETSNRVAIMKMKKPEVKRTRHVAKLYQSKSTTTFDATKDRRSSSRDKHGSQIRNRKGKLY